MGRVASAWRRLMGRLTPQAQRLARILLLAGVALVAAAIGFVVARQGGEIEKPAVQTAAPARPPKPASKPAAPQQAAIPRPQPVPSERDPAWLRFAASAPRVGQGQAMVAIVIDDMGLDRPRSMRAVELPGPLTLSYLPYGRDLPSQTALARFRGHELMVHLPMEPSGAADPGPNALTTALDAAEIRRRIAVNLDSLDSYVGVNNHMGSRFTAWRPGMEIVIAEMKKRGLMFLDSRTSAQSVGAEVATQAGVPHAVRHVFLDDVMAADNVRHQLDETERIARKQGFAIAIGHPHDNTLEALAAWLPTLREKGLVLVPLSAIVRRNGGR